MRKSIACIAFLFCFWLTAFAWEPDIVISTPNTSLVLNAQKGDKLRLVYFGEKITQGQVPQLHQSRAGLHQPAYPTFGDDNPGEVALKAVHADGNQTLELVVDNVETKSVKDGQQVVITLKDKIYPFTVKLNYVGYNRLDMIETWAEISHTEKKPVALERFDSGYLAVRGGEIWLSSIHGTWGAETRITEEPLLTGIKVLKDEDGARNGFGGHPEIMLSLDGKPSENSGRVVGAVLCWSGKPKIRIDAYRNTMNHIFAGINEESSRYMLDPKETFKTPKLALTFSNEGTGGASRNFHRWARNGMVHGSDKLRDVLLNSWEGVYMNVNEPEMDQMMNDIASMGGELFVMDDGWFGTKYRRVNDTNGLGDWIVDTQKLPNGIKGLTDTAKKYGIKFGIWIEPETANAKHCELLEKHPDWALQVKGRDLKQGRGGTQVLLDLCNPKVQDFVYNIVDTLLTNYPGIAYIKWDINVNMANYGSTYLPADRQSHIAIDYHWGLNKVLERIRANYPDVVIQACGSGGGRASYGVMPYFDEFWVSDNTDALQRIFIQWGTSYFYPSNAMAQHVSASPNHQTGRQLPIKFRFDVAMTGRLGMEIQPKNMTEAEKEFSKNAISTYKGIRPYIQQGNLYRLVSPYDRKGVASLMYTTDDRKHAVWFAYKMEHFVNQSIPRICLEGLDAGKNYKLRELNLEKGQNPSYLDGQTISGQLLMTVGIEPPLYREYSSSVFELTAED